MRNIFKAILLSTVLMLMSVSSIYSQYAYFPFEGTISYDKTIFVHNKLKRFSNYANEGNSKQFLLEAVKMSPENVVFKKSLSFKGGEARFDHIKEEYPQSLSMLMQGGIIESGTNIYQNLKSNQMKSMFSLAGQDILIEDSLMNIKWKITDEYRNIAGYNCRRANGVVLDSVYVVAFYTDEIPVSAGPSCFRGLPGMILGVAVPELHYNMFATKVDLTPVPYIDPNLVKKKGKALSRTGVYDQLKSNIGGFLGDKVFNLFMAEMFL